MCKREISAEEKITAINLYLDGKGSQKQIAVSYSISQAYFQQWLRNYEAMGVDAFTLKGNKKYPKELKRQAVLDYLSGQGSQDDICRKYGIRSKTKVKLEIFCSVWVITSTSRTRKYRMNGQKAICSL